MMNKRILIVDDNENQRDLLQTFLTGKSFLVKVAVDGIAALKILKQNDFDLIVSDVRMPQMTGLELLEKVKELDSEIPVLLVTAFADIKDAVKAIRHGAVDYLEKPLDLDEFLETVKRLLKCDIENVADNAIKIPPLPEGVVFNSQIMREVLKDAALVAASNAGVLITGESGSGKEVITDLIVKWSLRADKPLLKLNCAAIPDNLLESELFGHEKGAFTGAVKERKGIFEEADTGTVFLDEIGEMSRHLQAKLLRVTQDGTFSRIGSNELKKVDVRIIAATNRNLEEEITAGNFREDLYYRLNIMELSLAPLRERRPDIIPLAENFGMKFNNGRKIKFSNDCIVTLESYSWPGNIRELRNVIERAVLLSHGDFITEDFLPRKLLPSKPVIVKTEGTMVEIERQAILNCLRKNNYNRSKTALELGIGRRTLIYKLRIYQAAGYQVNK